MSAMTNTRGATRSHAGRQAGGPAVSGNAGFSLGHTEPSQLAQMPGADGAKVGGKVGAKGRVTGVGVRMGPYVC